jgi:hypothetical protein
MGVFDAGHRKNRWNNESTPPIRLHQMIRLLLNNYLEKYVEGSGRGLIFGITQEYTSKKEKQ